MRLTTHLYPSSRLWMNADIIPLPPCTYMVNRNNFPFNFTFLLTESYTFTNLQTANVLIHCLLTHSTISVKFKILDQWLTSGSQYWSSIISFLNYVNVPKIFFSPMVQQPLVGQDLPVIKTSQLIGLFWTSDRPDAETRTWQHTTLTRDRHPCPWVGFETTIPAKCAAAYPRLRLHGHWDCVARL